MLWRECDHRRSRVPCSGPHGRKMTPQHKASQTEASLKEAFAGEGQASRRYLYFAQKAGAEGYPDVAAPVPVGRRR
jgi:hypothetical protein